MAQGQAGVCLEAGPCMKETVWKDLGGCPQDGFLDKFWRCSLVGQGAEAPQALSALSPALETGRRGSKGKTRPPVSLRAEFGLSLLARFIEPVKFIPESRFYTTVAPA